MIIAITLILSGLLAWMGGLLFQNDSEVEKKVPLLGDLPLLGGLFRHTDTSLKNDELLVFVTPYVIDEQTLADMPTDTQAERDQQLFEPHRKLEIELNTLQQNIYSRFFDPNSM